MQSIAFIIIGFLSGLLGGMGMGGGTILIPALSIFAGVEQHAAQATNLIAFVPMAIFSLAEHRKKGLLRTDGLSVIVIAAVVSSVAFGFVSTIISEKLLKKLFGAFLIALAIKQLLFIKSQFK
jgi:hypothetical protein